jgi:hypothetical protein
VLIIGRDRKRAAALLKRLEAYTQT